MAGVVIYRQQVQELLRDKGMSRLGHRAGCGHRSFQKLSWEEGEADLKGSGWLE